MSKLFRQASRLTKTSYKFNFVITVESLRLHPIHQDKDVIITLTKGNKSVSTTKPRKASAIWGDNLRLIATLYRDKHGRYQEKKYSIIVTQAGGSKNKPLAQFAIDASHFASAAGTKEKTEIRSQKEFALLKVKVGCTFLKQMEGPGSEVSSVWSSPIDEDEDGEQDLVGYEEDDLRSVRTDTILEEEDGHYQEEHAVTPLQGRGSTRAAAVEDDDQVNSLKAELERVSKEKDALQSKVVKLMESMEASEEKHLYRVKELEQKAEGAAAEWKKQMEVAQSQLLVLEKEKEAYRRQAEDLPSRQNSMKPSKQDHALKEALDMMTARVVELEREKIDAYRRLENDAKESLEREEEWQEKLNVAEEQMQSRASEVARLVETVAEKENALSVLMTEKAEVKAELAGLREERDSLLQQLGEAQGQLDKMVQGRQEVEATLVSKKEAAEASAKELSRISNELWILKTSHAEGESVASTVAARLESVESEKATLSSQLLKLQAEVESAKLSLEEAESAASKVRLRRDDLEEERATLVLRVTELSEEVQSLKGRLTAAQGIAEKSESRAVEVESELVAMKARLDEVVTAKQALESELQQEKEAAAKLLQGKLEREEAKVGDADTDQVVRMQLEKTEKELAYERQRLGEMQKELERLREEAAAMEGTRARIQSLEENVLRLQSELGEAKEEAEVHEAAERELDRELQLLQAQLLHCEGEMRSTKQARDENESEIKNLRKKLGHVEEHLHRVRLEAEEAQAAKTLRSPNTINKAATIEEENELLREHLNIALEELEVNKREWREATDVLATEKDHFQMALVEAKLKVAQLSGEIDSMRLLHQLHNSNGTSSPSNR